MKKVILTGSSGLIGKEALTPLKIAGFEIFELNSKNCNLFNYENVDKFFEEVKPKYLLHFAWYTKENYLESDMNYKYLDASLNLLKAFKKNGGKRAVFAGTCAEYESKNTSIKESDPLNPKTIYAKCKDELRIQSEEFAKNNGLSFAWGRIFYVFGRNENEDRLTPSIINSLTNNQPFVVKNGNYIRDYMYTKDIAGAFVKFLDSDTKGSVNICTGRGILLKDFAIKIASKLGKLNLLTIKNNDNQIIIGDNLKLIKEIGYKIKYTFEEAMEEILDG